MPLMPILLIAMILASDAGLGVVPESTGSFGLPLLIACLPPSILLLVQWFVTRWCLKNVEKTRSAKPIILAERMAGLSRLLMIVNHGVSVLLYGWLWSIRDHVGDQVLLDEILAMLPPLVGITLTWALHYPVEQRIRVATLIRRLDEGRPIHPMPSRWRFVWRQFQFNVLLLLIPILLIMGLSELIYGLAFRWLEESDALLVSQFGTFGSGMLVFLFAPLLAKVLFSTQRLADGELRDDLLAIGARHRVNVRDLLLWKTDGTMINAAVMGLIAPLRYVLITDALIESMRTDEVRAVMAHEIGHVKRHHIPWMVLCLIALLAISDYLVVTPIVWMMGGWEELSTDIELWVDMALSAGILVTVLLGFGWVSRRFERQADTFAAQHLSGMAKPGERSSGEAWVITQDAVNSLQRALLTICRLHSVDPNRRSWRHGSISWRVEYLQSIVGKSIRGLRIDRIIIRIKLGALACVLMAVAYESSVAFPAVESVPDQESVQTRSSEAATLDDTEPETP